MTTSTSRQGSRLRGGFRAVALLLVSLAIPGVSGSAQETSSAGESIQRLVKALSSTDFAAREQASQELLQAGSAARKALSSLPQNTSLETKIRARWILQRIELTTFHKKAQHFLLESDPNEDYGFPAWTSFRKLIGTSRTSKQLFLEAVKDQRELLLVIASAAQNPGTENSPAQSALARCATESAIKIQQKQLALAEPKIGDFVALLFATATLEATAPVIVSDMIETNVHRYVFTQYLQKQGYGVCLRKMMGAWIPKTHEGIASRIMTLGLQHDIAEVAIIARKQLNPSRDDYTRQKALACIARYGNETDLQLVTQLLDDKGVVYMLSPEQFRSLSGTSQIEESNDAPPGFESEQPAPAQRFVIQIRDIALATAVVLAGEKPQDYFPRYRNQLYNDFDRAALATSVDDEESRETRILKWKQRHAKATPAAG